MKAASMDATSLVDDEAQAPLSGVITDTRNNIYVNFTFNELRYFPGRRFCSLWVDKT